MRREIQNIKYGDIVMADLSGAKYSEQEKERPCLIVQNNIGNKYSPTTIIMPLTSELKKVNQPTHTVIHKNEAIGLETDSMLLAEQVQTIDKRRIQRKIGYVYNSAMENISIVCSAIFRTY